jgi:DNA polymerase
MPSRGLIGSAHKLIDLIRFRMLLHIVMVYGSVMMLLKSCIRSMFMAAPGNKFICGDFSSIEGRVLAWLAGEDAILQAYRDGLCAYRLAAMGIFGVAYDAVTKAQRQIGKVIELACGFQGWLGAFHAMAESYGVVVGDDVAGEAIGKWRKARWRTKKLWADTEYAAIATVESGQTHTVGWYSFRMERRWLVCDLPSGRPIYYFDPKVSMTTDTYGRVKKALSYWSVKGGHWKRVWTYGGKLVENITQAIARDLLSEAMLDVESVGYTIVLHVHDEACSEIPIVNAPNVAVGFGTVEHYEEVMGRERAWAPGLPLKVEAWEGLRYRK